MRQLFNSSSQFPSFSTEKRDDESISRIQRTKPVTCTTYFLTELRENKTCFESFTSSMQIEFQLSTKKNSNDSQYSTATNEIPSILCFHAIDPKKHPLTRYPIRQRGETRSNTLRQNETRQGHSQIFVLLFLTSFSLF